MVAPAAMEDRVARPAAGARALAWWSDLRLDALQQKLADACAGWARCWGIAPPAVAVRHAWDRTAFGDATRRWEGLRMESAPAAPVAWITDTADIATAFAEALFGPAWGWAVPESRARASLAWAIADDAAGALRSAVLRTLGLAATGADASTPPDPRPAPPASDGRRWSGALIATVGIDPHADQPWLLHLSREALASVGPPRATRRPDSPLVPLREALAGHAVHLQARLDGSALTLSDLLSLRPGDVILTGHRLSEPLHVAARDASTPEGLAAALCGGHLGRRGDLRAVRLVATSGGRSA